MVRRHTLAAVVATAALITSATIAPRPEDQPIARAAVRLPSSSNGNSCPVALRPGPDAVTSVAAAARHYLIIFSRLNGNVRYDLDGIESLSSATWTFYGFAAYRTNAVRACGSAVVNRSWLAFVHPPQLVKCCSWWQARLYLARTLGGWKIWRVCNDSSC
jgi:hypothetical protein